MRLADQPPEGGVRQIPVVEPLSELHGATMCAGRTVRVKHIVRGAAWKAESLRRTLYAVKKIDPDPYQMHLAAWRQKRGLTLEQVGEKLDVAHTTVGRWERGELPISSPRLVQLCQLYTVTPAQLLLDPESAERQERAREAQELVEGLDQEALDHLQFVARKFKGAA